MFTTTLPLLCKNVLQLFSMYQMLEQQRDCERQELQNRILQLQQAPTSSCHTQGKAHPLGFTHPQSKVVVISSQKPSSDEGGQNTTEDDGYQCFFEHQSDQAKDKKEDPCPDSEQINSQLSHF